MREINYIKTWSNLLTPDIVRMLTSIHEFKGEQNLFIEAHADKFTELMEIAKIQSTEASNKIEGIFTSDDEQITVYEQIAEKLGLTEKYGRVVSKPTTFINNHSEKSPVDVVFIDEAHLLLTQGK